MKIVINCDYGGFGLSDEALREYAKRKGLNLVEEGPDRFGFTHFYVDSKSDKNYFSDRDIERNDPILVEIVETLKSQKASSRYASLKVVEIPEGVNWYIVEHDGMEHIAERHRTWQ